MPQLCLNSAYRAVLSTYFDHRYLRNGILNHPNCTLRKWTLDTEVWYLSITHR